MRQLNSIGCPVLVLSSENDVRYSAETAKRMAKMMPTAKFVLVEKVTRVSTLNPQPSTLNPQLATRNFQLEISNPDSKMTTTTAKFDIFEKVKRVNSPYKTLSISRAFPSLCPVFGYVPAVAQHSKEG